MDHPFSTIFGSKVSNYQLYGKLRNNRVLKILNTCLLPVGNIPQNAVKSNIVEEKHENPINGENIKEKQKPSKFAPYYPPETQ